MLYIFVHVVIHIIIKERGMLQSDPVKFASLVFTTEAASQFTTVISMLIELQDQFPTYSQSHVLTQKMALTRSCKLRSYKCVIYNRAGFVILQVKLQKQCSMCPGTLTLVSTYVLFVQFAEILQ